MFSLLQLLAFLKDHRALLLRILALSQDPLQNFPLATLSTNLSGMVLQSLREQYKIFGEINRRNSVFAVVNTLYMAAFYEMFLRWKAGNCTIASWNDIKTSVADDCDD
jgi:hypothetical protein